MGRILAIDYGRKRVGVAVTDPLCIIANGLETIPSHLILDFLQTYIEKENVDCIVVGYPLQMNNTPSESVVYIDEFLKKFKKKFPMMEVKLFDERFTSKMAFQTMIDGGVKKEQRKNKELIDKISATILLQSFLESENNKHNK